VYSIVVNSTGVYKLGNTLVGQLWLIISGHVMEFCGLLCTCGVQKLGNNKQLEKNCRIILGE